MRNQKMTIEQTRKEITKIQEELNGVMKHAKFMQKELYEENGGIVWVLGQYWGAEVKPAHERTAVRKADINHAYKHAQKILKVAKETFC